MRSICFTLLCVAVYLMVDAFSPRTTWANDVTCVGGNQLQSYNREAINAGEHPFIRITPTACEHLDFTNTTALSAVATTDAPVFAPTNKSVVALDFMKVHWKSGGNVSNLTVNNIQVLQDTDVELRALDPGKTKFDIKFDHEIAGTRTFTFEVQIDHKQFVETDFIVTTATKVTSVQPATGPQEGGTRVTITGVSLTGVTAVTFNGKAATNVVFISDTEIQATTPDGVAGAADVRVTSDTGFNAQAFVFTYEGASTADPLSETESQIVEFMHARAVNILNTKPDITPFLFGSSEFDGLLGNLDLDANAAGFNLAFSSSLGRIWSAREANEIRAATDLSQSTPEGEVLSATASYPVTNSGLTPAQERGFDMWIQVHATRTNASKLTADTWIGHAGAPAFVNPDFLVGAMVQLDWTEQSNSTSSAHIQGLGFMVGPYMAAQVPDQNLFFDSRVLWGKSSNAIKPTGSYEDRFVTERWLISGKLSGAIESNGWKLQPAIEVNYFKENLSSYTDSQNNLVSSRSISLGEVRFGPTVSHEWTNSKGVTISPSLGVAGVWNFAVENEELSPSTGLGSSSVRARFDVGLTIALADDWAFNISGFYDGVGVNDFEAYGGKLRLSVPLP